MPAIIDKAKQLEKHSNSEISNAAKLLIKSEVKRLDSLKEPEGGAQSEARLEVIQSARNLSKKIDVCRESCSNSYSLDMLKDLKKCLDIDIKDIF